MKDKKINELKIMPLSRKEVEVIAWLESYNKYFFTAEDIQHFFANKKQRYNFVQKLMTKKRIIKINRHKYFLVPIKARSGGWSEDAFVIADEIMDGKDYFIGGWAAANYYRLTDQIPFWIEVYTTKRQGRQKIFNAGFIFRRTTPNKIKKSVVRVIGKYRILGNHSYRIINKREAKKWMKLRQYML